jgi:putative hemolysin
MAEAFGLGDWAFARHLFGLPARRLARQATTYDAIVGHSGLAAGGAWALKRMSRRTEIVGGEMIPREGPLLVVSNHPGLADAVALFTALPREDLRVVAAERPFLEALPNTSRYLCPFPETPGGRFRVVRAAARHLRDGGALLTFPAGRIEPDPAVLPGAQASLERWSASVDLFARLAPGLRVVPVIVSGVLSPAALGNPLTRLRRRRRDREWLAATLQILTPSLYDVTVRVEFGAPVAAGGQGPVAPKVISQARRLVHSHRA